MITSDDRAKLIEYLYKVAVEPEQFDTLMEHWGKVLDDGSYQAANDDGSALPEISIDDELMRHIEQASEILGNINAATPTHYALEAPINLDPNPAILLDGDRIILVANDAAQKEFSVETGSHLSDMSLDEEKIAGIYSRLDIDGAPDKASPLGLVQATSKHSGQRIILAISHVNSPLTPEASILITTLSPMWNDDIQTMLQDYFKLSSTEADVVQGLVQGSGIKEIAAIRKRSIDTIRNQIKSVLRKTGTASQVELVGLIGGLKTISHSQGTTKPIGGGLDAEYFTLQLPDGRVLEYFITGPHDGRPVLYFHGMLDGYQLPPAIKQAVADNNLRLIAPARPGYSKSTFQNTPASPAEAFADDLACLLDHLKIGRIALFGNMAGSAHAQVFASRHAGRASHLVATSGMAPYTCDADFDTMSGNHRKMAQTIRRHPKVFPMLMRAGSAVLQRRGEDAFLDVLYRDAPIDLKVFQNKANRLVFNERFRVVAQQNFRAFIADMIFITSDWSEQARNIKCPVLVIHGVHDKVASIDHIRRHVARTNNARLIEIEDAGQLVFYQYPDMVLNMLADAINTPARQDVLAG